MHNKQGERWNMLMLQTTEKGKLWNSSALLETCPLNEVIVKCQFPKARTYFCIIFIVILGKDSYFSTFSGSRLTKYY